MKQQLIPSALLIVLFATFVFAQVATTSIEGNWSGAVEAGGIKLRVVFKVSKTATGFQAKFDSLDQGAENLDLIAAALKAGNNKDFTTKSFPKLNTISEWILKRTK